jgi:hypothetical protein
MKIKVSKLNPSDRVGTPESFEAQFEKRRSKGSGRVVEKAPKLKPIENKSFQDRMEEFGIPSEE